PPQGGRLAVSTPQNINAAVAGFGPVRPSATPPRPHYPANVSTMMRAIRTIGKDANAPASAERRVIEVICFSILGRFFGAQAERR
ncbi:hypothetical protein, partial [Mesorhizobium sp.]|uniref:hypothetical protein n=1 Tax=Mesorhizobium sp. TaxID=1871066 RepID=UPI0025EBCB96